MIIKRYTNGGIESITIKVISLWQPWALAMWNRHKEYETRCAWAPIIYQLRGYNGIIGIHSAKLTMEQAVRKGFADDYALPELHKQDIDGYSRAWWEKFTEYCGMDRPHKDRDFGVIGGLCWCGNIYQSDQIVKQLSERERFLGNYESGRKVIHCPGMVKLDKPMRVRGSQGASNFTVPSELHNLVMAIAEERLQLLRGI